MTGRPIIVSRLGDGALALELVAPARMQLDEDGEYRQHVILSPEDAWRLSADILTVCNRGPTPSPLDPPPEEAAQ